jgi:hypothetical protein
LLLEGSPEQRLTELLVLPVYEALLASTGEETIDWKSFRTRADDYSHGPECGSNMRIPASAHRNTDAADAKEKDIRALRARTPGLDRWNWDERKEFLYIVRIRDRAYVVRAMNMIMAVCSYLPAIKGAPAAEEDAFVCTWPGLKKYDPETLIH